MITYIVVDKSKSTKKFESFKKLSTSIKSIDTIIIIDTVSTSVVLNVKQLVR